MADYSLADVAAAAGNEGNFGGNAWILIILFALIFGFNGNGFGNRGYDGYGQFATSASQQEILFGQQFQNIDNKMDRLGYGIADSTFALNNATTTVGAGVAEAKYDNAIRMADLGARMQDCCCTTQRAIDGVNANIDNKFAALEKSQLERELAAAQGRITNLEMQNMMNGVVKYPNAFAYNAGANPFCGCGNGCCM